VKGIYNGYGQWDGGPDIQLGSPVPAFFRNWEWLTARGVSATSWDFQ
jgi:hypothetical protein